MSQSSSNIFTVSVKAPSAPKPALPAWVPPAGYFADVPVTNTPASVTPSIYPADNYLMNGPFIIWGGSAFLRDYSPLGAQVFYSGGHEPGAALPNAQFSLTLDFSTLRWKTANVPLAQNPAYTFVNGYAPDGTPYCPHTYLGLQEMPTAWGGGQQGTLVSFFWSGSMFRNRINLLDVSRAQLGYSVLATRQVQSAEPGYVRFSVGSDGGNFPITVMDEKREGWWAAVNGQVDFTLFVSKTGQITQYPALGGNLLNASMVICPSLDLLIAIDGGYSAGAGAGQAYRTLHILNMSTGKASRSQVLGTVPSRTFGYDGSTTANFHRADVLGLQWVEELGCIVGLDQTESPPALVRLTPPASNPATNPWTWGKIAAPLHWPQDSGGQATLQQAENGYYSKFRWIPTLQAFVVAGSSARKPQIIKLT